MWSYLYPACTVVGTTLVAGGILTYHRPSILFAAFMKVNLFLAGASVRYLYCGNTVYCVAERGARHAIKPSLLLLHGFTASKDMWIRVLKNLPKDMHIVMFDLPGHGGSSTPGEECEISIDWHVKWLHTAVAEAGLEKQPLHIVGTSLGGALAAAYAGAHPERVSLVSLVCPAMRTPVTTPFLEECERGGESCRLIPTTEQELREMLTVCMYANPPISQLIIRAILQLRVPRNDYYRRLFRAINEDADAMDIFLKRLSSLEAPTQAIWGKHDQLIDVSGVDILRERVPHLARVDMIEDCGHSVAMERPGMLTKLLMEFNNDIVGKHL